jgi:hypothetical protein
LAAFRYAADAGVATVRIREGQDVEDAVVRIDEDGAGVLESKQVRAKFAHVGLWQVDAAGRLYTLTRLLKDHTMVSETEAELKKIVSSPQFGPEALSVATQYAIRWPRVGAP